MPRFSSLPSLLLLLSLSLALLTSGCTGDARMSRLAGTWQLNLKASQSIVDNLLDGQMPEDASFMDKMKMGAAKAVVKSQINKAIEATGIIPKIAPMTGKIFRVP